MLTKVLLATQAQVNKNVIVYSRYIFMKAILIGITIAQRAVVLQAASALVCAENLGCKW